jgi:enoyl-CoA hydratase/carnithine racemase
MDSPVLYEQRGRIVTLTLNKPKARNPLDNDVIEALVGATARINRDESVSCAILTGAGDAFCSGGNVKDMKDRNGMFGGAPSDMRRGYNHGIQKMPLALYNLEVPSIAAVNGPAMGAGCDLAMMCDLRVAADTASFAESFLRVGLISGDGGAWFLPRVLGITRAYEMAFTGDAISAAKAASWGAITEVVSRDKLMEAATALADRIARNPPQALRLMKRLVRDGLETTLPQNLEMAAAFQAIAQHTEDQREALTAMLEKREPAFKGK